jgi:hypothetical protein
MSLDSPTIVSFAVPKPQDVVDIKEQLETYRLLNKASTSSPLFRPGAKYR